MSSTWVRSCAVNAQAIAALNRAASWTDIFADLNALSETEIEQERKRFIVRSAPRPAAIRAAGVVLPPTVCPAIND